jgi:hypothetical protein
MTYKAFLSHSMAQEDLGLVYEVARQAQHREVTCYIAERDYQIGNPLPAKIEQNIRDSDCLIVFLTRGGAHSGWVNQEVGFAKACGKLILPVVEKGIRITGFLIGLEYVEVDRYDPLQALSLLAEYLGRLKSQKDQNELATAALLAGGVLFLLLLSVGRAGGSGPASSQGGPVIPTPGRI